MAATIQTIQKPTRARGLDTSGNNNHAQIYSGRALEFDGVTDYLDTEMTGLTSGGKFTVAGWFYLDSTQQNYASVWSIADWETASVRGITMRYNNSGADLSVTIGKAGTSTYSLQYIIDNSDNDSFQGLKNSWHRYVVVVDSDASGDTAATSINLYCYIDGVLVANEDFDNTPNYFQSENGESFIIGKGGVNETESYCSMKASDVQFWDKAWTQEDATYDYLNPEQLALNRGGTSLTNSNLKVWYPMNEGHRGNQSYVLDASNTGLGDELLTNTDMSLGDDGSWSGHNLDGGDTDIPIDETGETVYFTDTKSYSGGKSLYVSVDHSGDGVKNNSANAVVGVTYRMWARVWVVAGTIDMHPADAGFGDDTGVTSTTTGEWEELEVFATCDTARTPNNWCITQITSTDATWYIDAMSVKAVNDKNNATTVFYGDDLFDAGVGDYGDSTGAWVAQGSNGMTNDTSALKITYADNDDGAKLMLNNAADLTSDLTVGRSYRLTYTYKINTDDGTTMSAEINQGDSTFKTSNLTETSFTTLTQDFVAAHATNAAFRFNNMDSGDILWIKDVSLKEIGTATGWTDADQQLDIPQTALQSYNQLAWFDGEVSDNKVVDDEGFTPDDFTTVSFWMFYNKQKGSEGLFDCIDWSGGTNFRIYLNSSNKIKIDRLTASETTEGETHSTALTDGKWHHILCVIPKDAGSSNCTIMIDGEEESFTTSSAMPVSSRTINLTYGGGLTYEYFEGCITEVAVYSDALTTAEKLELYNDGKAADATTVGDNLVRYWRNNGLATWTNLANPGTADGVPTSLEETMLITAGVDSSRDSQGFLMNRKRSTNSLNVNYQTGTSNHTFGKVLSESGAVDDGLSFLASGTGGGAMTITCWVKPQDAGNGTQQIISKNNNTDGYRIQVNDSSKTVSLFIEKDDNHASVGCTSSTALANDTWYFIAGSYDGDTSSGESRVYIGTDSSLTYETANSSGVEMNASAGDLFIGAHNPGGGNFVGEIDDICIYNKELTALEADGSAAEENDVITGGEIYRNYKAGKRSHR